MTKKIRCQKCEDGWVEVDPSHPEEANTPQYIPCDCQFEEEADMSGAGGDEER